MAESRTLTVRDLVNLHAALALEGHPRIVKDEKGGEKVVIIPYVFGGATRWALSRMLVLTKGYADLFSKTRDALIKELSGGDTIAETDTDKVKAFNVKLNEVLDTKEVVDGILTVTIADLKLDENPIATNVLVALTPIIKDA